MLLLEVMGLRREGVPGNKRSVLLIILGYMEILLSLSLSLILTISTLICTPEDVPKTYHRL